MISGPIALIKKSIETFFKKENLSFFLKIQLPLLPLILISVVWSLVLEFGADRLPEGLSTNPVVLFSASILGFLNAVIYLFVAIASIFAIKRVFEGGALSFSESYSQVKSKLLKFGLVNLLRGLILLFGFLLLIVPGVIFLVWFTFAHFEVVLTGAGVKESLSKSKALVAGKFWKVLGRLVVFGLFQVLVQTLLTILPLNIGSLISPLLGILFILPVYFLYQELVVQG